MSRSERTEALLRDLARTGSVGARKVRKIAVAANRTNNSKERHYLTARAARLKDDPPDGGGRSP